MSEQPFYVTNTDQSEIVLRLQRQHKARYVAASRLASCNLAEWIFKVCDGAAASYVVEHEDGAAVAKMTYFAREVPRRLFEIVGTITQYLPPGFGATQFLFWQVEAPRIKMASTESDYLEVSEIWRNITPEKALAILSASIREE